MHDTYCLAMHKNKESACVMFMVTSCAAKLAAGKQSQMALKVLTI